MEKAIKKAKLLGNTGMVLVIIGLTGFYQRLAEFLYVRISCGNVSVGKCNSYKYSQKY